MWRERDWSVATRSAPACAFVAAVLVGCAGSSADAGHDAGPQLEPRATLEAAEVIRVVDGDTIVVSLEGEEPTVRYIGIDAPESVAPGTPDECLGEQAAGANADLVGDGIIYLERDVSETDRFDRLLRYAWVRRGDGWLMVNAELVRLGFADAHDYPPDVRHSELLEQMEREARERASGMWGAACAAPTGVSTVTTS